MNVARPVDESHRQKAYRLAYVISQFPILRMQITSKVSTDNDKVASVLSALWGTGQMSIPYQIMNTLMRSNLDRDVQELLAHADLKRAMAVGTQHGFYLSNEPTGLGGRSQMASLRSKAAGGMAIASSRVEELNDRLRSSNNPLWFVVKSQDVAAGTSDWIQKQWETALSVKVKEYLQRGVGGDQLRSEMQRYFFSEYLFGSTVAERAAAQFVCAEMAAAVGLLQVVVIDDEIDTNTTSANPTLVEPVSSNALRFRSVYGASDKVTEIYEAWKKNMQDHDEAITVLKHIATSCLLKAGDPSHKALYNSLVYISKIEVPSSSGSDTKKAVYPGGTYRGNLFKNLGKTVGAAVNSAMTDVGAVVRRVVSGSSKYRLAHFIAEWVQKLRVTAGKAFVFYLPTDPSAAGKDEVRQSKRMLPGWHSYAARDGRRGDNDERLIQDWIGALVESEIDLKKYSPIDLKQNETCEVVVGRAAEKLGIEGTDRDNLIQLTCETSGSCLDNQYAQVMGRPGTTEDRADALARLLLKYNTIGCGDTKIDPDPSKKDAKLVQTLLCESRVQKACKETSDAACGANIAGSVKELKEKMCSPRANLRNELSDACAVSSEDAVDGATRHRKDAECIRSFIQKETSSETTCWKEIQKTCDQGREGWALITLLGGGTESDRNSLPNSVKSTCVFNPEARQILDELQQSKVFNICMQLDRLLQVQDDILKELVGQVKKRIECRGTPLKFDTVDTLTDFNKDPDPKSSIQTAAGGEQWIHGGTVVSPDEYQTHKFEFERNLITESDNPRQYLTQVFEMIKYQCVGMEEAAQRGELFNGKYGLSRFVHRMLYPNFKDANEKKPFKIYTHVVGSEYVDWILIVLNKFLARHTANEATEEEKRQKFIEEAFGALKTFSKDMFEDTDVLEHLYERLAESVDESQSDGKRMTNLGIRMKVMVLIGNVMHSMRSTSSGRWKAYLDLSISGTGTLSSIVQIGETDLDKRRISARAIEETGHQSWWRKLLTLTTFPVGNVLAKRYLQELEAEMEDPKRFTFEELYAGLLCATSAYRDLRYSQTIMLNAMESKVIATEEGVKGKISEVVKVKYDRNDAYACAQMLVPFYYEIITGMLSDDNFTFSPAQDDEGELLQVYGFIASGIKTSGDDNTVNASDAIFKAVQNGRKARQSARSKQLQSGGKAAGTALAAYYLSGVLGAANPFSLAALAAFATIPNRSVDGIRNNLVGRFKHWLSEESPSNCTTKQRTLYAGRANTVNTELAAAFRDELILLCVIYSTRAYEVTLQGGLDTKLSELTHVARFHMNTRVTPQVNGLSIEFKAVTGESSLLDLLPSKRISPERGVTLTGDDVAIILEYSQALLVGVTAALAAGLHRKPDDPSRFYEALFRTCSPPGADDTLAGPMANVLQDTRYGRKVFRFPSDPITNRFHSLGRWHLYSIVEYKRSGMCYFPFSKKDERDYENLIRGLPKLGDVLKMVPLA